MEKTLLLCKKCFVSITSKFKKEKHQKSGEICQNYNYVALDKMSHEELQSHCCELQNELQEEKRINHAYQMVDEARRKMNNMWQDVMDRVTNYIQMDLSATDSPNWDLSPINDGGGDRICEYELMPTQSFHKKPIKHRPGPAILIQPKDWIISKNINNAELYQSQINERIRIYNE